MKLRQMKYNPSFLTDDELVASFIVRHEDLRLVMDTVRENVAASANQHVLIIGPRGVGKTTMARMVALSIQRDQELCERWYPIMFAEESYQVSSPGEFWLEAVFHLARQTTDQSWRTTYEELRAESDDKQLQDRALAQLLDYADARRTRLLLVVENLNMLLGEQIASDDVWRLRKVFQNEPRIMVLATATSRFEEIAGEGHAMFEVFRTQELPPLTAEQCARIWKEKTGRSADPWQMRPIQILTGGNPRLLSIISSFGARMSFRELMDDLIQLVDDHTEYFKSHLDSLPPSERKVYLALAELWDPSTTREVAAVAREEINKTSSFLKRLESRGAVLSEKAARQLRYRIAERMYNIYYLMRRRGGPSDRVRAVVRFMTSFYGPDELIKTTSNLAEEACRDDEQRRRDCCHAFECILQEVEPQLRDTILEQAPREFLAILHEENGPEDRRCEDASDADQSDEQPRITANDEPLERTIDPGEEHVDQQLREAARLLATGSESDRQKAEEVYQSLSQACPLDARILTHRGAAYAKNGRFEEAERAYRNALDLAPDDSRAWEHIGRLLHQKLKRYEEAEQTYRRALELNPASHAAWAHLGELLHKKPDQREAAEQVYRKALALGPKCAPTWANLARLLQAQAGRQAEAEQAYRRAIELAPQFARAWVQLGTLLFGSKRYEEAEQAYCRATELEPDYLWAWTLLARLHKELGHNEKAEQAYQRAIQVEPRDSWAWTQLARLHEKLEYYDRAELAFRRAIALEPKHACIWVELGQLLCKHLGRYGEAEQAYRKAIALEPRHCWAWVSLGELLHTELHDYGEAEQAYRRALKLEPQDSVAWLLLGRLHEQLGRSEEAEQAYRTAVRFNPKYSWAWGLLGLLLHSRLRRYDEAERAYRRAIEQAPMHSWVWMWSLAELLDEKLDRHEEANNLFEKAVQLSLAHLRGARHAHCDSCSASEENPIVCLLREDSCLRHIVDSRKRAGAMNQVAWAAFMYGGSHMLNAVPFAREAVDLAPDESGYRHTLICLLVATEDRSDALNEAQRLIASDLPDKSRMSSITDVWLWLAAANWEQDALDLLLQSGRSAEFEPLVAALRIGLHEELMIAPEVLEVAKDVLTQIERRRARLMTRRGRSR